MPYELYDPPVWLIQSDFCCPQVAKELIPAGCYSAESTTFWKTQSHEMVAKYLTEEQPYDSNRPFHLSAMRFTV